MASPIDQLMLRTIQFLKNQAAFDALFVLSSCTEVEVEHDFVPPGSGSDPLIVTLYGSQLLCDSLLQRDANGYQVGLIGKQIEAALEFAHNYNSPNAGTVRVYATQSVEQEEDWRLLLANQRGEGYIINNQLSLATYEWNELRFASQSEVKIAQALDRVDGVMFFPNSMARVGNLAHRKNRCPDFLICYDGKWGILEVDGSLYHPTTRTVDDHERDRLFKTHGVMVIEHYDAERCFNRPVDVVREFLELLSRSFSR